MLLANLDLYDCLMYGELLLVILMCNLQQFVILVLHLLVSLSEPLLQAYFLLLRSELSNRHHGSILC